LPLLEKARIEVYIPDLPTESHQNLIEAFEEEFTYAFGGSSIVRGIDGSYLSRLGLHVRDRVNLVYTDMPVRFEENIAGISQYTDAVRNAAYQSLQEEAVLVVTFKVFHSE